MIFDIPEDLIDDLVYCPSDESNHLHIGYWILDQIKQENNLKSNNRNVPYDKEAI